MKKYIAFVLTLACVLGLVGCAGRSDLKNFKFGNVSRLIVISVSGERFEVTDTDTVQQITENIESIQFEKGESSENSNGFGPFIQWYDANDNLIESISVMAEETIIYDGFFWTAIDGNIDYATLNEILENGSQTDTKENISTEGVADYPAAIMVNDTIYLVGGIPMSDEVDDSAIIGYTESFRGTFPENNGETNFNPELGMPYAQVEGGIAVLYENEWYLATPMSNVADENTITFDGVIIDNTIDTLVPTICVKPLLDEIPYDAVFFELPDNEVEWVSKVNSIVTITCADIFTEQAPHYGTLISITGLTTEADNYLISVASVWDKEEAVKLSAEDAALIADLVESGNWLEGTSDCMDDCIIFMDGEEIHYHSDCGTFNDTVNEKRLHLTEKQQAEFNAILEKYIVLNAEFNAILEE